MIEVYLLTSAGEVHQALCGDREAAAQTARMFRHHPRFRRIVVVYRDN